MSFPIIGFVLSILLMAMAIAGILWVNFVWLGPMRPKDEIDALAEIKKDPDSRWLWEIRG